MGKVAFGTGPHGQGLTGTAKCLLCPLDPPFPSPSEFFPLTQITTKSPLPLIQQRAEHIPALGILGLLMPCLCPGSPQCLSHTPPALLLPSWRCNPGAPPCSKPPDPGWNPQQRWEFMHDKRAARQGRAAMDLFTWDPFPPVLSLQPSCLWGGGDAPELEFWISDDPNSFGAMIQVSCTLCGTRQWEAQPSTVQSCLFDQESWSVAVEFLGLQQPGCALNVCLQGLRRLICRSRG